MKRATVEELCDRRRRALDLYRQGFDALRQATALHFEAAQSYSYCSGLPDRVEQHLRFDHGDGGEGLMRTMTQRIDRDMWRSLAVSTRLESLMDQTERRRFDKQLEDDPPPCTPDAVFATLDRLAADAGTIFRRGLVTAFQTLCRKYKSNDGFKVGRRTVLTHVCWLARNFLGSVEHHASEQLQDVDRCMYILDGKPTPTNLYAEGIVGAARQARTQGLRRAETEYWRLVFFHNGNAHLWCKRSDLLNRVNRLIAEHYGLAIGRDSKEKR